MRRLLMAAWAALALMLLGLWTISAAAHANLDTASPGPGDTVGAGTEVLSLTFVEDLDADAAQKLALLGPDETTLAVGPAARANSKTLCARTVAMKPGVYTLEYRVTSADGHSVQGRYSFEVTQAGPSPDPGACASQELAAPTAAGSETVADAAEAPSVMVWVSVGAVVVVLGLAGARIARSRRGLDGPSDSS